jgi:AmiR/NasT family two-component response regulator
MVPSWNVAWNSAAEAVTLSSPTSRGTIAFLAELSTPENPAWMAEHTKSGHSEAPISVFSARPTLHSSMSDSTSSTSLRRSTASISAPPNSAAAISGNS